MCTLCLAEPTWATTYYVRDNGDNGNTGTANTAGGAWATITHATDQVAAGDIIRVQAGNYVETATPSDSGTSGNTVTIVADGVVTTCGMTFTNVNYIRVIGLTFDGSLGGCTLTASRIAFSGTNTGLEFWNVHVIEGNFGFNMGTQRCNACVIVGGTITGVNNGGYGIVSTGNDIFVGYVAMDDIDYLGVAHAGLRGRFVNLNFSGFLQIGIRHPDFFFPQGSTANTLGYSNNLIESIYGIGTPDSNDNKVMHLSNQSNLDWEDNVWRNSVFHDMGSGFFSVYPQSAAINRFHFYNITLSDCVRAVSSAEQCGAFVRTGTGANPTLSATIKNFIFYEAWSADAGTPLTVWTEQASPVITKDYNLAYDPDGSASFSATWTGQANEQSNVDPAFTTPGSDFTLQAGSGARGVGGHLTTATSCSGTTLNVAAGTGGMFIGDNSANLPQYGGALVPGDVITVNSTNYQVASVATDALTLTSAITCSNGDPVYFGTSSTIDIGAYPYKAGGYTITASHSSVGGTTTIAPNDSSLVRFVVCYEDSVPYAVDNSSPYTCSTPSGEFSAKVYPRYASATLGVESVATTSKSGRGAVKRRGEN